MVPKDPRRRILDAALGLLAEHGAQELTQPRIARAAGLRQSHLTYYFPTRADLLQAVARHSIDALVTGIKQAGEAGRLSGVTLGRAIAAGTADKRRARVMLGLVNASDRDPALKPRLRAFVRELRGRFAEVLAAGGMRPDAATVAFLHTVAVGAAVLQLARDDAGARREARAVLERAVAAAAPGRRS
jgi:AcrR family transcriptional regulator